MEEPADTLAEKHKARRQAQQRSEQSTSQENQEDLASPESPSEESPAADDAQIGSDLGQQVTLLDGLRALPRQVGHRAGELWTRLTRRWQAVSSQPETSTEQAEMVEPIEMAEPSGPEEPPPTEMPEAQPRPRRNYREGARRVWHFLRAILWRGRIGPAFWTVASLLSVIVNIILIVILILLGRQLFFIKETMVSDKLVGGLYDNFVLMDQAHIRTTIHVSDTIQVNDTIPVVFDLPLNQKTTVILTKDTPVNTTIFLNNVAVPLDLILKEGTELNIKLNMSVPVNQTVPVALTVPVQLTVPVDIPLDQTELHKPFVGLQQVVSPYRDLLGRLPSSWSEVCKGSFNLVCKLLRFK